MNLHPSCRIFALEGVRGRRFRRRLQPRRGTDRMTIDAASFWAEGRSPTLATVRLRTKVTKGAGSREAGMAMAFKLLDAAQARWRRINGHELVPLVRAGATFIDGKLQERKEAQTGTTDTNKTGSVAA